MAQVVNLLLLRDVAVGAARELDVLLSAHHLPDRLGLVARLVPDVDSEDHRVAPRMVLEHGFDRRVRVDAAVPIRLAVDSHCRERRRQRAGRHHMVDAQPTRMAEARAHGLDERPVAVGAQPPQVEGEQPPVLAAGVELVGRSPDRGAVGVDVAVGPRVGSVGVDADGEVVHERELARRDLELAVERPLHPRVEAHAFGVDVAALPPGAERRVAHEGIAELGDVPVERVITGEAIPRRLERLELQPEDRVAVDVAVRVHRPCRAVQLLVVHPEVQQVPEAATARVVGARLLRHAGRGRVQWAHEHHARPETARPARQPPEVLEVADPPALPRAQCIELHGPTPCVQPIGQVARTRAHDEAGLTVPVAAGEAVVADW